MVVLRDFPKIIVHEVWVGIVTTVIDVEPSSQGPQVHLFNVAKVGSLPNAMNID